MLTATGILLIASWFAPPCRALPTSKDAESFGVLLDAGSTSTKMKIYKLGSFENFESVPQIDLIKSVKFKPGLSAFEDDNKGLKTYIENILDKAKGEIPADQRAKTPLFLMATAGLRFLTARDATLLIDETRKLLADKERNPFLYNPEGITILSGEEEGAYSWTAVNYLRGYFDQAKPLDKAVGILEMGGGSTQIAFIPKEPLYAGEFQVTIAGRLYQIYDHSYLGFGLDAIGRKIADELVEMSGSKQESYENPCMLKGDKTTLKVQGLGDVALTGAGDASKCEELIKKLLHKDTGIDCQPKPCAIGGVYQPNVKGIKFYATSAFNYAPYNLGIVGDDNVLHLKAFREGTQKLCERNLDDVLVEGKHRYPSNDCIMGIYAPLLFTQAYGFDLDTTSIQLLKDINGQSPDWALGAMLIELSRNHWNNKEHFKVTCKK